MPQDGGGGGLSDSFRSLWNGKDKPTIEMGKENDGAHGKERSRPEASG